MAFGIRAALRRRQPRHHTDWRRGMRREIAWLLALKFVALALLWFLFFSPAHRRSLDSDAVFERFTVLQAPGAAAQPHRSRQGEDE